MNVIRREEKTLYWQQKCEKAEAKLAKLNAELKKAEEEEEALQQLREEQMKRLVVPTVSEILRQAVYEKLAGIAGSVECTCGQGKEPENIRAQKDKFIGLGFGEEDVYALADLVSFDFFHLLIDMQHNELKLTLSISGLVSWKTPALLAAEQRVMKLLRPFPIVKMNSAQSWKRRSSSYGEYPRMIGLTLQMRRSLSSFATVHLAPYFNVCLPIH